MNAALASAAFTASPDPGRKTRPRAETIRETAGDDLSDGPTLPSPATVAAPAAEAYLADVRWSGDPEDRRAAEIEAEDERFAAWVEGRVSFA